VKLSSVRYVNSGFQTHSQRMNTHGWGKTGQQSLLPFVTFQVTSDEIEQGVRDVGHAVRSEANCATTGNKQQIT